MIWPNQRSTAANRRGHQSPNPTGALGVAAPASAALTLPTKPLYHLRCESARARLSTFERVALAVGIVEIPLGVDKYFLFAEEHAQWGAVAGFTVSLTSICLALLYGCWAILLVRRELLPSALLPGIPQLIYLSAVGLSVLSAQVPRLALCDLFLLVQAYALFFYVANRVRTQEDFLFIVRCLATGLGIQGAIMIGQKAMGPSAYGMSYEFMMMKFDVWEDGRTAGTLHSAVLAGSWLAIGCLVVLPLFLVEQNRLQRIFLGTCLGIGMLGMLFTQTRGALITVGAGTVLIGMALGIRGWLPRWVNRLAVISFLLAVVPVAQVVQNRILRGDEGSAESRRHLTLIAAETIARNPIWGYGAGNCHLACLPIANSSEFRSEWYFTIHCKYLLVWIESGLPGLVAFLWLLLAGVRHGIRAWWTSHPLYASIGLGCSAALAGHMLHMFVDIFNSRPQVQTLWLVLGIAALTFRLSQEAAGTRRSRL